MTRTDPAGQDDVPARFLVDFTGQTLLGQYRIERRLAEGGMGSVYLAEDTNLGRRVVVKVPHARFLGDAGFRARFRREIEELVRLEHPHVVRILARGEQDGIPFFVLQFLGGGSLEDRLGRGALAPADSLAWLATIAETLDFLHGRGVIHRDVKPANILFDEAGHVFLSDFGVVKALGKDDGADLTAVGTGVGSPLYMAPEQGMGHGVTAASDQYALASALYESLAGAPPFGRGSVIEILVRKGREDAAPLRGALPELPEACEQAVARALARDPGQRFPTCAQFVAAFRTGLAPTPAPVPVAAAPRPRWPFVVGLLAFGALALAAVLTRGFGAWAPPPPAAPPPPVVEGPAPAPATGSEEPMILLSVLEPGSEPRRLLRWSFTPGRREAWSTRTEHTQSVQLDDAPPQADAGASDQDCEVVVSDVDAEGRARLAWTFHPERPLLEGGATAESVAMEQKIADALGTVTGTSRLTPAGISLDIALASDRKLNPAARRLLVGLEETMRNVSTRLPDDPVGVGAKWETKQIKDLLGVRYQEIARYTVVGIEGKRLHIAFEFDAQAPNQPLAMPGVPADAKLRVLEFTFTGTGTSTADLDRIVPIEQAIKGNVVYAVEASGSEQGKVRFSRTIAAHSTAR